MSTKHSYGYSYLINYTVNIDVLTALMYRLPPSLVRILHPPSGLLSEMLDISINKDSATMVVIFKEFNLILCLF